MKQQAQRNNPLLSFRKVIDDFQRSPQTFVLKLLNQILTVINHLNQLQLEQVKTGKVMTLTRDLKVDIVARRFWKEYIEPAMPEFDVSLFMPALNKIKSVTDRMKNINKYIIVRGHKEGKLQLRAKSGTMKTSVSFEKCDAPEWNTDDDW